MDLFTEKYSSLLKQTGILPVVCLKNEKELHTFLDAILLSEIRCVEITLRHPFSTESIQYIKKNHPQIIVGAGTVKTHDTLFTAIECGADFCVAPGTSEELLNEAEKRNMPFLPGGATPSEFMLLSSLGFQTAKFFPAECSGGVNALKLYEGAFSELSFLPTGGITASNFEDYCRCKNIVACGGSFMVPYAMVQSGDSTGILNKINELLNIYERTEKK